MKSMRKITGFIFLFAALNWLAGFPAAALAVDNSAGAMVGSISVPFVANEGQVASPAVKYYARTFGGTVYALADGKIVYSLPKYEAGKTTGSAVITEILRGAFQSGPSGAGKSLSKVSSFIGGQPEKWKSNLPVFDKVDFGEVYEGVNLLLSARGNNVEKIFVLSPGADPREIALGFEGVSGVEIMPDGKLELQTALGAVYFTRPVAWQIDARGKSLPVAVDYAMGEDGQIGFELSSYDPGNILVIDPLLASTFIGGGGSDAVQAMAIDSQTNVYVAGYTDSSDFPVTNTPYSSVPAGLQDVFVSKFNAGLGTLAASTYIGGSSNDQATALGVAADGRVWVAGYTESTNFPAPGTPMFSANRGGRDAFVTILSADLSSLDQATYLGGSNTDYAAAIAMDNSSLRQYVVGYTESRNFLPVITGYRTNYVGARDAFVVLFSNNVGSLTAGTFLGGTNTDEAAAVVVKTVNSTNYLYVAGSTSSTNFPVINAYKRIYGGGPGDAFVSRLGLTLTNLIASTFLGGTSNDAATAIDVDVSNRVYVAGYTTSTNFSRNLTNNVYLAGFTNASRGAQDIFVSCLTNNLTNLYASTYIGGTGDDVAKCLAVGGHSSFESGIDSATRTYVYLAGYTASANFPTTRTAYDRNYHGGEDAFLLRLDGPLTNMHASTYLGGVTNDRALALALAPDSNTLFVAGVTASSNDFPATDAAYRNVFSGGADDGFVAKMPAALAYGTVKWQHEISPDGYCSSPAMGWDGAIMVGTKTSLQAIARSGARWEVATTSSVASQGPSGYEGLGSPCVGTNNVTYINTSSGKVHAITADHAVDWTYNTALPSASDWSSIGIDNSGRLYFSRDTKFFALNPTNGSALWTNTLSSAGDSSPAISSNGTIYVASTISPKIYAYAPAGSVTNRRWTTDGGFMYSSPALDTDAAAGTTTGTVYAMASNTLYALNSAGTTTRTWRVTTGGSYAWSSPAIGSNNFIYVGAGSYLYALNTNGTTGAVWAVDSEIRSSPAVAADGSIIAGTVDGFIYSFNTNGTTNWTYETDFLNMQSPLIDSEGTIYVSDHFNIYALYGSAPPADSAWPMFRHDALRTGNQGLNAASLLKPATPTAIGKPGNYIQVSWSASPNALSYELWRYTNDTSSSATRIARLAGTSYNDSAVESGQLYNYWVKVKTPVTISAFSETSIGSLPPAPPEYLSASKGVPTNYVQLTWHASPNVTNYSLYRGLTSNSLAAAYIASVSAPQTNYDDTTVSTGLRYYYWVMARNAQSAESAFSTNDYGGIPCSAPTGLTASQGTAIRLVALNWNISTGAVSYLVYRNIESNSATAEFIITNVVGLGTNDISGTPLCRYYYWLKATNEFGLSVFSEASYGWSLLAPPNSVSANAEILPNTIRVSWIAGSSDAAAHSIFRGVSSDPAAATWQADMVYNTPTATNYDDTSITLGPAYYYWVAAKNSYGTSAWAAASAPAGLPPASPTDLDASDGVYSNMVRVSCNASPGATSYAVYRNVNYDPSSATLLGSAAANVYEDTTAVNGTLYYYWIKAGNRYGFSPLSTFNSGWRGMVPPDSVSAGNGISTGEVSITWSAAPGASAYELWRGTAYSAASASRLVNNIAELSYSDQSAIPGTVYYYRVKAKNGNYSSVFSSPAAGFKAIGILDIGVSDFVFVPTIAGALSHPSAVSFAVANLSGIDMTTPNNTVQYDFYLSTNAVFGNNDSWIGGTNSAVSLPAGASTRIALPQSIRQGITIPSWATSNYYVFVYINHCLPSVWLDPNLANNVTRRVGSSISIAPAGAIQPVWNDFDGDGKSDLALYQAASTSAGSGQAGTWLVRFSTTAVTEGLAGFGGPGYRAIPRDYDGDGKFDPALYQSSSGGWRVSMSASGYQSALAAGLGGADQSAVPADYDGDGLVDPAVYREVTGTWRVWMSGSGYVEVNESGLGGSGWRPVPADYDGDARTDPAVYQESSTSAGSWPAGTWLVWLSGDSYRMAYAVNLGGSGQSPVPADYDGDGKVDLAVYHEASGTWRVWPSGTEYRENSVPAGGAGQKAAPGDYDGDGLVDLAVYWESMGMWRLWFSSYQYAEMDVLMSGGINFQAITAGE